MSEFLYPLDVTGAALSNRVRGEFQTLSPPTQSDNFHFIIPKAGPYYRDTLKIRHVSTNRELKRGIDWEPGHYFHSASYETEGVKGGIYQSILFLDRTLSGQIHLEEYFALGGHWSLDENKILEILSNRLWDPRTITYEQVSGKPEVFPPIEHMHPAGDLVGMREQVEATHGVAAAIREQTEKLPGNLRLILEDYYTESQIDRMFKEFPLSFLETVTSNIKLPIIESKTIHLYKQDAFTLTEIEVIFDQDVSEHGLSHVKTIELKDNDGISVPIHGYTLERVQISGETRVKLVVYKPVLEVESDNFWDRIVLDVTIESIDNTIHIPEVNDEDLANDPLVDNMTINIPRDVMEDSDFIEVNCPSNLGERRISTVTHLKLKDPDGKTIPIHYRRMEYVGNKFVRIYVFKPKMDLTGFNNKDGSVLEITVESRH